MTSLEGKLDKLAISNKHLAKVKRMKFFTAPNNAMPLNVKSFLYDPPVGLRRGGGEVLPLVRCLHAGHEDEPQHPVLHQQPPPPVQHPHTCNTSRVTLQLSKSVTRFQSQELVGDFDTTIPLAHLETL